MSNGTNTSPIQTGPFGIHYREGNWFGLPDFGATEAFGGDPSSIGGSIFGVGGLYGDQMTMAPAMSSPLSTSTGTSSAWGNTNSPVPVPTGGLGGIPNPEEVSNFRDILYNRYAGVRSGLENRIGGYSDLGEQLIGNIGSAASASKDVIGESLAGTESRLTNLGEEAKSNKKLSLRELSQDMSSAMRAANVQLGSIGASDSSAAGMFSHALSKGANRRSADLSRQLNDRLNDIGMAMEQARTWATEQISKVDQWFATESNNILTYVQGLKDQVVARQDSITNAELASLEEEFINAREMLEQITVSKADYQNQIAGAYDQIAQGTAQEAAKIQASGNQISSSMPVQMMGRPQVADRKGILFPGGFATEDEGPQTLTDLLRSQNLV